MNVKINLREQRKKIEDKDHSFRNKVVSLEEAVKLVSDGDHLAIGGCMYSRTPMAAIWELIRQGKKNLTVSRNLASFETDLLLVGGCVSKVVSSWYGVGVTWGLSRMMREFVETGRVEFEELSHLAIALRYKAAAMGVPFLPTFSLLGSDLLGRTGSKVMRCPFSNEDLCLVPALFPDVTIVHTQVADVFGNVQIQGLPYLDADMAAAAHKVIVTTERLVSNDRIRRKPESTSIPFFCVDAVVQVSFGAYPNECPGLYEPDFEHFDEYVRMTKEKGERGVREYLDRYVYAPRSFEDYLELFGVKRLLRSVSAVSDAKG